jgi:hypothetical protein
MPVQIPQVRRILFNDERVGMGFNSESGLAIGTALENFTVEVDPNAPGQEVDASITIVNTHEELMDSLGMSFEAHGRYGLFSGSIKARFSERSNYNSTSTFLVARCVVENPFTRGANFEVKPAAHALLDALRFEEFKTAFGDSFVRGLQTGGEFYSVIRITSVSTSTQTELAASAHAAVDGLITSLDFKAELTKANANASTKTEFSAMMLQRAGSGEEIAPTVEIDEVKARFKGFPTIVKNSPVAYEAEVATYDTLPLPVPTAVEQEAFLLALLDAREKKLRYIQTRNDLDFARRNPLFFESLPHDDVLTAATTVYTQLLNAVLDHAIKLSRGQITPPRVFDPSTLTPPIIEPTPIPLKRVTTPTTQLTVRVPNLIGIDNADFIRVLKSLGNSTVDELVAGLGLSPDVVEFLFLTAISGGGQIRLKVDREDDVFKEEELATFEINAQFPSAGTLVAKDAEILTMWIEIPPTN